MISNKLPKALITREKYWGFCISSWHLQLEDKGSEAMGLWSPSPALFSSYQFCLHPLHTRSFHLNKRVCPEKSLNITGLTLPVPLSHLSDSLPAKRLAPACPNSSRKGSVLLWCWHLESLPLHQPKSVSSCLLSINPVFLPHHWGRRINLAPSMHTATQSVLQNIFPKSHLGFPHALHDYTRNALLALRSLVCPWMAMRA